MSTTDARRQMILEHENEQLRRSVQALTEKVEELEQEKRQSAECIDSQTARIEELELQVIRLARAAEKRTRALDNPAYGPTLFDDLTHEEHVALLEALDAQNQEAEEESQGGDEPPPKKSKRKKKDQGVQRPPKTLPAHLPVEEVIIDVPVEERTCTHTGKPMNRIGEERTQNLKFVPAHFKIVETVCVKYGCNCDHCRPAMIQGQKPESIVPGSYLTESLLAEVIASKLDLHQPLYRKQLEFAGLGFPVRRNTLCGWIGYGSELLNPLVIAMRDDMLKSFLIHSDDTSIRCLKLGAGQGDYGHIWVYIGDADHPHVFFDFTATREGAGPAEILKHYKGFLHVDAYSGYEGFFKDPSVIEVACWAHTKRYFEAALPVDARADHIIGVIKELYRIDRKADGKSVEERLALRQKESVPLLNEQLWPLIEACRADALPKSKMGAALTYIQNQWQALLRFTTDGRLELDNNIAEREFHAVGTGRRNWLFVGNENGGRRAAILYSIVRTCRFHGVVPSVYLNDVLTRLPRYSANNILELAPHNWKQTYGTEYPDYVINTYPQKR